MFDVPADEPPPIRATRAENDDRHVAQIRRSIDFPINSPGRHHEQLFLECLLTREIFGCMEFFSREIDENSVVHPFPQSPNQITRCPRLE